MKNALFFMTPLALVATSSAFSATTLPYLGPNQAACRVNQPTGELQPYDAGYVTSEACDFVYILPPVKGTFELARPAVSDLALDSCPAIRKARRSIFEKNPGAGESTDINVKLKFLSDLRQFEKEVERVYDGPVAMASGGAFLHWNELVNAYKAANPDSTSQFMPMPIRLGVLSVSGSSPDPEEYDSSFMPKVKPQGIQLPDNYDGGVESGVLPPIFSSFFGKNTFVMGQAMGLSMEFRLGGACLLVSDEGVAVEDKAERLLSATYTYLYPVQTKGSYTVSFNQEILKTKMTSYLLKKKSEGPGAVTADEIKAALATAGALKVEIQEGAFPESPVGSALATEYKQAIMDKASEYMIGAMTQLAILAVEQSTAYRGEDHSAESCKRKGPFGLFKSCSTAHWTVMVKKVDWDKVIHIVSENMNPGSAGVEMYKTFYTVGTSAVVPKN